MYSRPINLLVIEDNPADIRLLYESITDVQGTNISIVEARSLAEARSALKERSFDVILLDLSLPDSSGLETFSTLHDSLPEVPVVVMSGTRDQNVAVSAVRLGAQDYLVKGNVDGQLLIRSLYYAIERKKIERELLQSLREKELLLKEVHHRVKNNLQTISSLLGLQVSSTPNEDAKRVLQTSRDRVHSMALIHEQIYKTKDLSGLEFADYVKIMANGLFASHRITERVKLKVSAETGIPVGLNEAIPCGLILNELISNALKHAFPDNRAGTVEVIVTKDDHSNVKIVVRDDGVGMPAGADPSSNQTLGFTLINTLTAQLGGKLELDFSRGTAVTVVFAADIKKEPEARLPGQALQTE